jgi:D-sedoheptulose 7-phosphate isomerase
VENRQKIIRDIEESRQTQRFVLEHLLEVIETAAEWMTECLRSGGKILFFGNGGSAADAQHLAAEIVGRFEQDRPAAAALALSTDTSILTSVSNDYGFDHIFLRQIEGLGRQGDIALAISTSGQSANIVLGLEKARQMGLRTIGLLGKDGGPAAEKVDLSLIVPGRTARIQEAHILIGHILCGLIEEGLFGEKEKS